MISAICRDNLKAIVTAYSKATGQTLSAMSKEFYGNTIFLQAFFSGKQSISIDKYDSMVEAMKAQWPENASWPLLRAIMIKGPEKILSPRGLAGKNKNRLSAEHGEATQKRG